MCQINVNGSVWEENMNRLLVPLFW